MHRTPAPLKLLLLSASVITVSVLRDPWLIAGVAVFVIALFALAQVPVRAALGQILPILWMLLIVAPIQGFLAGWVIAGLMAARLLIAVALAALFTMTTSVSAVLDTFQLMLRPFRRWLDADRIGLLVALTIRCIPLLSAIVAEVLEARAARGIRGSVRALAVPVIVRSLYAADALGEALIARGFDD
ncbi:CbiQ family ECF transporter T component [Glaciibacter psychrotolerans]|uniref:Biotin transport system permease protein n=1 Tax=Glaciibacter psychrotolerans TaxID=670054 RepID=A0A7Z0J5K4_9MICO|nr:biotin transport system permease protein [Leifsonia psychrotolerans]